MKLIRHGVFETNSSSCHSLSICKDGAYEGMTPDSNNEIVLDPCEFGWGVDDYYCAENKMAYLWIYIKDWSGDSSDEFMEIFQKVVCEHTGADRVVMRSSGDKYYEYGYIDHQSVEDRDLDYMFSMPEVMKSFIFNPQSYIHTDNDNH